MKVVEGLSTNLKLLKNEFERELSILLDEGSCFVLCFN
jgi:hypothetical protein